MDELFDPPGGQWRPVSRHLVTVKRIMVWLTWGLLTAVATIAVGLFTQWWIAGIVVAAGLALTVWRWSRMPVVVAAMGWCERGTDLCVRSGPWFRSMTIVPYGRMQSVEINSGPLMRHWGLASVELVTASAGTDATIPGLTLDDATELRDRITAMAEERDAAL